MEDEGQMRKGVRNVGLNVFSLTATAVSKQKMKHQACLYKHLGKYESFQRAQWILSVVL